MLYMHEVHCVAGENEKAFEEAFRDGWMKQLGESNSARLLWYLNQPHGSGPSYNVVTITGFEDASAWEQVAKRVQHGDLREGVRELDAMRHSVRGKLLRPLHWSPMQDLDLTEVPCDGQEHELTMYMQDTMWIKLGKLHEYIDVAGSVYQKMLETDEAVVQIRIQAGFQTGPGAGIRPEVTLMQKIFDHQQLLWLLTNELPETTTGPGTWMQEALQYRDQWESRLLRTAAWSPLF